MTESLIFIAGVVVGGVAVLAVVWIYRSRADQRTRETFAALASEALDANSRRLSEMSAGELDGKKALIDQAVTTMNQRLESVRDTLGRIEADRRAEFGRLGEAVGSLSQTAGSLHRMLASTQRRGAWGERMAEDVLRLAGMLEGVNYTKQATEHAISGRADFTFFLPNQLKANMDVKFPLEAYKAYIDAANDADRQKNLKALCMAVKGHVKEVACRGYIDPAAPTVPYVIVFLPSEQIFALVMEAQSDLIDESLRQKVVLASPLTLYAMLSVIRQAAENANLMRTADEVLSLLGTFNRQWQSYLTEMDKLGDRIESAAKQYQVVRGTRTNALQRPLEQIETLRNSRGLESAGPGGGES